MAHDPSWMGCTCQSSFSSCWMSTRVQRYPASSRAHRPRSKLPPPTELDARVFDFWLFVARLHAAAGPPSDEAHQAWSSWPGVAPRSAAASWAGGHAADRHVESVVRANTSAKGCSVPSHSSAISSMPGPTAPTGPTCPRWLVACRRCARLQGRHAAEEVRQLDAESATHVTRHDDQPAATDAGTLYATWSGCVLSGPLVPPSAELRHQLG